MTRVVKNPWIWRCRRCGITPRHTFLMTGIGYALKFVGEESTGLFNGVRLNDFSKKPIRHVFCAELGALASWRRPPLVRVYVAIYLMKYSQCVILNSISFIFGWNGIATLPGDYPDSMKWSFNFVQFQTMTGFTTVCHTFSPVELNLDPSKNFENLINMLSTRDLNRWWNRAA